MYYIFLLYILHIPETYFITSDKGCTMLPYKPELITIQKQKTSNNILVVMGVFGYIHHIHLAHTVNGHC